MQTDVTFSLAQLLWIIGGITAIAAFLKWAVTPLKKIEEHESRINTLEKAEADRKSTDRYIVKALNALINFNLDEDSGKDDLRKVRDEYQNNMIDHL